jgi:hypothetical protein
MAVFVTVLVPRNEKDLPASNRGESQQMVGRGLRGSGKFSPRVPQGMMPDLDKNVSHLFVAYAQTNPVAAKKVLMKQKRWKFGRVIAEG